MIFKVFHANQNAKEIINTLKKEKGYLKSHTTYGCYDEEITKKDISFNSNCKNCGAPLKPHNHKCEYCATYQNY